MVRPSSLPSLPDPLSLTSVRVSSVAARPVFSRLLLQTSEKGPGANVHSAVYRHAVPAMQKMATRNMHDFALALHLKMDK
mmetsp:Transcript_5412/g.12497  ORF Transcript_5412/g.12497 Transcript_5412/m.12497 type:complete len:80 (-) Transcript_5412:59-298(-)